jgi:hypothetical protein
MYAVTISSRERSAYFTARPYSARAWRQSVWSPRQPCSEPCGLCRRAGVPRPTVGSLAHKVQVGHNWAPQLFARRGRLKTAQPCRDCLQRGKVIITRQHGRNWRSRQRLQEPPSLHVHHRSVRPERFGAGRIQRGVQHRVRRPRPSDDPALMLAHGVGVFPRFPWPCSSPRRRSWSATCSCVHPRRARSRWIGERPCGEGPACPVSVPLDRTTCPAARHSAIALPSRSAVQLLGRPAQGWTLRTVALPEAPSWDSRHYNRSSCSVAWAAWC